MAPERQDAYIQAALTGLLSRPLSELQAHVKESFKSPINLVDGVALLAKEFGIAAAEEAHK